MFERFSAFLLESGLIMPGQTVVLGYSGGADSTCLLHLLHRAGVDVIAAHLHHGMRDEADKEMALCQAFCDELGVPFAGGRADVPLIAKSQKIGLEEAGRIARKDFFRRIAAQVGGHLIATAHTRDDHVETVLFHLARGTGLAGLVGIPLRRENQIRPLIHFGRSETRKYCADNGLWFHDDPANEDLSFARARLRHRVVPEMRLVHEGFDDSIARLSEIAQSEDEYLDSIAASALEHCSVPLNGNLGFLTQDCEVAFDRLRLLHLQGVLVRRALRLVAEFFGAGLSYENTLLLIDKLLQEPNGAMTLEGGDAVIEWDEKLLHVRQLQPILPFRFPLTVPGETASTEFGWQFIASRTDPIDFQREPGSLDVKMDPRKVKGNLYFRTPEPEDQIQRVSTPSAKPLSALMGDKSLTSAAKQRIPVVCDLVGPIWVPGIGLSDRVKISDESENALWLRFEPVSAPGGHNELNTTASSRVQ